jgi:putative SOS response-associated peptidase YedK
MCNLYQSTPRDKINFRFLVTLPLLDYAETIAPLKAGPFVMSGGASAVGQWGLIPHNSKTRKPMTTTGRPMSTNNARRETLATAWTYRFPWARGQRCLIPCDSFDEPYWGTGKNIWWRFARADGEPWALAGIWSEWTDLETGEVVPSYSMITQNCDAHPLLRLMHRPDPKLPPDAQDKRAVVPIESEHWDQWLHGPQEQAEALIGLPSMECIRHAAADPTKTVPLPM